MKLVNYEKKGFVIFLVIFLFILLFGLFVYTWYKKINSYSLVTGRVRKKNLIELYIKDKDMNIIYKNSNVYIGDKKASFSIVEVNKDILIDSDDKYNLVLLKTKASLNDGEIVELTFKDKRISLFKIFDVIWKGWVREKVNNLELQKITGGVSALALVGIAALIIFISGVLDGFTNPGRCNGWRRKVIWT